MSGAVQPQSVSVTQGCMDSGGPGVKSPPSSAGDVSSIPDGRPGTPHARGQSSRTWQRLNLNSGTHASQLERGLCAGVRDSSCCNKDPKSQKQINNFLKKRCRNQAKYPLVTNGSPGGWVEVLAHFSRPFSWLPPPYCVPSHINIHTT